MGIVVRHQELAGPKSSLQSSCLCPAGAEVPSHASLGAHLQGHPSSRPSLEGTWGFRSYHMQGLFFVLPDPAFLLSLQVYFWERCSSSPCLSISESVLRKPIAEHTLINLHFKGVTLQKEVKKSLYFGWKWYSGLMSFIVVISGSIFFAVFMVWNISIQQEDGCWKYDPPLINTLLDVFLMSKIILAMSWIACFHSDVRSRINWSVLSAQT